METLKGNDYVECSPRVNSKSFANTLRYSGYTEPSQAIADIIDNSIEPNLNTKQVQVLLPNNNRDYITIIDDGAGMSIETMAEALTFGSNTGKSRNSNYGCYGFGLKTAGSSMGMRIDVFSIEKGDKEHTLVWGCYDITDEPKVCYTTNINIIKGKTGMTKKEIMNLFIKPYGTVVLISALDRVRKENLNAIRKDLITYAGKTYSEQLSRGEFTLTVDGKEVKAIDVIGTTIYDQIEKLTKDGAFFLSPEGDKVFYEVYYVPSVKTDIELAKKLDRSAANSGFYIYRNERMVGNALSLGLMSGTNRNGGTKHSTLNGFRAKIFMGGETADKYTNSTYTKSIKELSVVNMQPEFADLLRNIFSPLITKCRQREESFNKEKMDEAYQEQAKIVREVLRGTKFEKVDNPNKDRKTRNKKEKTEETKPRNNTPSKRYPGISREIRYEGRGETGNIVYADAKVITINTDHPLINKTYKLLSKTGKITIDIICCSIALSCERIFPQGMSQVETDMFNEAYVKEFSSLLASVFSQIILTEQDEDVVAEAPFKNNSISITQDR